jgi:uncharacterized phiE125 gp8 family phage protein
MSILTIITPASAANQRLCTLAAVKAELGISGAGEDTALDLLRDSASAAIASWCGRVLAEEVVQQLWRPICWAEVLILRRRPVTAISSITEDGVAVAAGDRELDADAGMLWRLSSDARSTWRASKIVASYTAGYRVPDQASPTLPADIQRAAVLTVAAMYHARGRDPSLRSESSEGVASRSWLDPRSGMEALTPQAAGLLAPYREVSV